MNKKPIFISGRFRAGTSLLWNIFHSLDRYESWYEPLHPNLLSHIAHVKPKSDHLGIDDYWQNYKKLDNLEDHYSEDFGQNRLFLEKDECWPELKSYIDYLLAQSTEKTPVLQFNRMDLRLGWLRNQYPHALIIHIHREPESLWQSNRKHLKAEDWHDESHPDAYDLLQWSVDLAESFPMLLKNKQRSSYFRHYFIWKLGRKMAQSEANLQINLHDDLLHSDKGLQLLAQKLQWNDSEYETAKNCVQAPHTLQVSEKNRETLADIEKQVDSLFKTLGLERHFPSSRLQSLKIDYQNEWQNHLFDYRKVTAELLSAINYQKDELTAALNHQPA